MSPAAISPAESARATAGRSPSSSVGGEQQQQRRAEIGAAADAAVRPRRRAARVLAGGMRWLRPKDIRQILSASGGQAMARLVSAVLALPSGPRRRDDVLH